MPPESLKVKVVNNPEKDRFEVDDNGQLSVLVYQLKAGKIFLTHTEVPPELENKGLGSNLAHAALEYARRSQLRVVPVCPFIQHYVDVHPEYNDLLSGSESA
jgi:predicted GNAT family acetyltransferase